MKIIFLPDPRSGILYERRKLILESEHSYIFRLTPRIISKSSTFCLKNEKDPPFTRLKFVENGIMCVIFGDIPVALLPILQYPDDRLRKKAATVIEFNDDLKKLAADMAETMYAAPGVGLAATQINKHIRLIVMDVSEEKDQLLVLVNPEVIEKSEEEKECEEGCLSLPGIYETVCRPARVKIKAQDLEGKFFELDCDNLMSVCVQHEMDHLLGKVFVDYLSLLKKSRITTKLVKQHHKEEKKHKEDREY